MILMTIAAILVYIGAIYIAYKIGRHKMYYEIMEYLHESGGKYEFEIKH